MALGVKFRNLACASNMTRIVSLTTIHAPASSLNCGLFEKPSALKKAIDFGRSATGRLMNTWGAHGFLRCVVDCDEVRCGRTTDWTANMRFVIPVIVRSSL